VCVAGDVNHVQFFSAECLRQLFINYIAKVEHWNDRASFTHAAKLALAKMTVAEEKADFRFNFRSNNVRIGDCTNEDGVKTTHIKHTLSHKNALGLHLTVDYSY